MTKIKNCRLKIKFIQRKILSDFKNKKSRSQLENCKNLDIDYLKYIHELFRKIPIF